MNTPPSFSKHTYCVGIYETNLQENRAFTLAERFRAILGDEVVILSLPEHALRIYPRAIWEELKSELL